MSQGQQQLCVSPGCCQPSISDPLGSKGFCSQHACMLDGCRNPRYLGVPGVMYCSQAHITASAAKCQLPGCGKHVSCSPEDGRVFDYCCRAHAEKAPCKRAGCANPRAIDPATGVIYPYCSLLHKQEDEKAEAAKALVAHKAAQAAAQAAAAAAVGSPAPAHTACVRATPGRCRLCGAAVSTVNPETGLLFEFCSVLHARQGSPLCPVPQCTSVCATNPAGGFFAGCCREHSAWLDQNMRASAAELSQQQQPCWTPDQALAALAPGMTEDVACRALEALQGSSELLRANACAGVRRIAGVLGALAGSPAPLQRACAVLQQAVAPDPKASAELAQGPAFQALLDALSKCRKSAEAATAALELLCAVLPDARGKFARAAGPKLLVDLARESPRNARCQLPGCGKHVSCSPEDGRVFDYCCRAHAEKAPCKRAGCANPRAIDPATGVIYPYCSLLHKQEDEKAEAAKALVAHKAAQAAAQAAAAAAVGSPAPAHTACVRATPGRCRLCGAAVSTVNPETGLLFEFCSVLHARQGSPLCPVPQCTSVCATNPAGGFFAGCCREHSAWLDQNMRASAAELSQQQQPCWTPDQALAALAPGMTEDVACRALEALQGSSELLRANACAGVRRIAGVLGALAGSPAPLQRACAVLQQAVAPDPKASAELAQGPAFQALLDALSKCRKSAEAATAALELLCAVLPDARGKFARAAGPKLLVDLARESPRNARVCEAVFAAMFVSAPASCEQLAQLGAARVVLEAMAAMPKDAELMVAASRALMAVSNGSEAARAELAGQQVAQLLARAQADHPTHENAFLNCRDALGRAESDEIRTASTTRVCSSVYVPRCMPACCAGNLLFCPECCTCQWFRQCLQCADEDSRMWYCVVCALRHHEAHKHRMSAPFFLPGVCACTRSDCRIVKPTSPLPQPPKPSTPAPKPTAASSPHLPPASASPTTASGKPLMKRTPASVIARRELGWDETQLAWQTVVGKQGDDYECADVPQGSPLWKAVLAQFEKLTPGQPKPRTYRVTRIEAVNNSMLTTAFDMRGEVLERRRGGEASQMFHFAAKDPDQKAVLERLRKMFIPQDQYKKANFTFLWHGCAPATAKAICLGGLADLRRTDGGFFGSGVYLTPQAQYAALYAAGLTGKAPTPTEQGEYTVLLAAGTVGLAYPVTRKNDYSYPEKNEPYSLCSYHCAAPIPKSAIEAYIAKNSGPLREALAKRNDKALKPSFDTHFVGVSQVWRFQAAPPDQIQYDEVVTAESQVLPLAIVYFKIGSS
eukprot:m51a1_g3110 hypothetical protein (1272) ;mRNA; f:145346-149672